VSVAREPTELPEARRAVAVGTFDGVHRGHLHAIDAARRAGLRTAVVTFDPHPRTVLGGRVELLATLQRRLELLADAGAEDALVLQFDEELQHAAKLVDQLIFGLPEELRVGEYRHRLIEMRELRRVEIDCLGRARQVVLEVLQQCPKEAEIILDGG